MERKIFKKEGFNLLGREKKGRPGVSAKIVPELLENQDKEGKMWDLLLLLPGARKQPIALERDTCPWDTLMRGSRGNPRSSCAACTITVPDIQSVSGSAGQRRCLSFSRDVLKKKTGQYVTHYLERQLCRNLVMFF